MTTKLVVPLIVLLLILFTTFLIGATEHSYVGIKFCKMCHQGEKNGSIYEKWQASKHSQATANMLKSPDKAEKCFNCHSTGYGKGGYDTAVNDTTGKFDGVQCEACHGPGSDYKKMDIMKDKQKSIANGLIMPKPEDCKNCHNNSYHKDMKFDYATAWPKIEHKVPAK
jgi:predicted CxxxxCH...CXXCH cytochrome family protein